MFIRDFSWTHEIGHRPEVELKISDVKENEFMNIRELAAKGEKIKIEEKVHHAYYPIPDVLENYARRDVEVTAKMLGGFTFNRNGELKVEKVIFNKPATIVFWSDNTKTVVVCGENDTYDEEKGFFIACTKKLFGNDYRAVGRMNKALEMAVVQMKEDKK